MDLRVSLERLITQSRSALRSALVGLRLSALTCLALGLTAPLSSFSAQVPSRRPAVSAERIRALVDSVLPAEMQAGRIPGAAVAVVVGDSVLFAAGYGVASAEGDMQVTPDALFRIASTTKMLTAAAVLSAQAQGLLDLDAPISTWAPDLHGAIGALRLRDLLRHRSGLREGSSYFGPHDEDALSEFVRQWSDSILFAPSDDVYSYSNLGYSLAGHLLARATGTHYSEAMWRFLFAPLGMTRSTLLPTLAMTYPLVQGHDVDSAGQPAVVRPYSDDVRYWPAGSVFTSAHEFARFVVALLNGGRIGEQQALHPNVVTAMLQRQTVVADGPPRERPGYTFGLLERWRGNTRMLQHGGARIGFGSVIRLVPEHRAGIVILANRTGALPAATLEALTALLVPEAAHSPAPALESELVRTSEQPELPGRYLNAAGELELTLADSAGFLVLRQGAKSVPIRRVSDGRYSVGGQLFSVVRGDRTPNQYLVIVGHALRKIQ